jgi:hypothetical protein
MRRIFFFAITIFAISWSSCNNEAGSGSDAKITTKLINNPATAKGEADTEKLPAFTFDNETWDFGLIAQGEKVSYTYKFKNTGKSNLIISSAKGSCGCTVPDYPKKPIAPGGEGIIEVVFDSDGKSGAQNKTITILANTYPATTTIYLKGEIAAPGN